MTPSKHFRIGTSFVSGNRIPEAHCLRLPPSRAGWGQMLPKIPFPQCTLLQSAKMPRAVFSSPASRALPKDPVPPALPKCLHSLYSAAGRPGLTSHACHLLAGVPVHLLPPAPSPPPAHSLLCSRPSWHSLVHQVYFPPRLPHAPPAPPPAGSTDSVFCSCIFLPTWITVEPLHWTENFRKHGLSQPHGLSSC